MTTLINASFGATRAYTRSNELGMRPMQARAFEQRGEQYILVKSPPASGKSRCLMFLALDKMHRQGVKQVIVAVPEKSIGKSFASTDLMTHGFWADWEVAPRWNLCDDDTAHGHGDGREGACGSSDESARGDSHEGARGSSGEGARGDGEGCCEGETTAEARSKVRRVGAFLESNARVLVCTHATLRFAYTAFGPEAFDNRLLAIDEFHHASAAEDNLLGRLVHELMERDEAHLIAMTGSYFRGDDAPVLRHEDEVRFTHVTFSYFEQLNGYEHLKTLGIAYRFYSGSYLDSVGSALDTDQRTIIHIPSVNSSESTKAKHDEVDHLMGIMGDWISQDPETGLHHIRRPDGAILKVANLVEDDTRERAKIVRTLRNVETRDDVHIIIALGMAKEGFDWVWCEHALTIGYRRSLTEVIQIIGRATRDAPGKTHARFTNMIATPAADQDDTAQAVNDLLKAISASLLMEQVLAPRITLRAKQDDGRDDVEVDEVAGGVSVAIKGLKEMSETTRAIVTQQDLLDLQMAVATDPAIARAQLDPAVAPEVVNNAMIPAIIQQRFPELEEEGVDEVREQVVAQRAIVAAARGEVGDDTGDNDGATAGGAALIEGVRRFVHVQDLNIDLIDSINPADGRLDILAKTFDTNLLEQVQAAIAARRPSISEEEVSSLTPRLKRFLREHGRGPSAYSEDPVEQRLAAAVAWLRNYRDTKGTEG